MIGPRVLAVLLLLGAVPAFAQTAFAQTGTLQPPKPGARPDAAAAESAHPKAAPVTPVERAGSTAAHPAHPAKPTPVVRARANSHAEKPAGAGHEAAHAPAKPEPPPPPRKPEPTKPPAEPDKGTVTGLPLPRYAALRSDEVNLRVGPGMRFPIEWQYHRRELPVEILREVEVWRLVEDQDGVKGWVHQATLTGRRSFVVKGTQATLRGGTEADSSAVAILKPGVVGRIRHCAAGSDWCEVQVGDYRGWLRREAFWGTFAGETVN